MDNWEALGNDLDAEGLPQTQPDTRPETSSQYCFESKLEEDEDPDEVILATADATLYAFYEQNLNIAGAIARHYERLGLIHPAVDFSWEWHVQFGAEYAAATEAEPHANAQSSESIGTPGDGSSFGFGSDFSFGGTDGAF